MLTTVVFVLLWVAVECTANKKYCWYFEGGYPIYFICRSYEDCCGTRCCVRALSIQRLWYFWLLLMLGVVFCCGAGFFLRRRMYPSPLPDDPASFNVHFTRQPITASALQQNGLQSYGDPGGGVNHPVGGVTPPYAALPPQPSHVMPAYPTLQPPPAYCSLPPPPYEQVLQEIQKK